MRERKARIKKLRLNYFVLYTCSSLLLAFFVVAALTSAKYTELTELGFKGFLSFLGMVAFGILSASRMTQYSFEHQERWCSSKT